MSSSTPEPGARLGKYCILAHIATGGMGTVYKAFDEQLGRVVALKVLSPELANNPTLVERFKREARHAARLDHKNLVRLYDSDTVDGQHYIAMEYIDGVDLCEYIRRKGKLDPEEARRIVIQACKALSHAYSLGITHRDIKPSNFLMANEGGRCRIKLTDLGLARVTSEDDYRVTRAGTTVGTVDYMAPEQARDAALADIRSDIYGLGCTLYHMLAGQPPFGEGGLGERVYKHLAADPADVRLYNEQVSAGLWAVLRRMLAKHPDDRYQTPDEVVVALRAVTGLHDSSEDSIAPPAHETEALHDEPPPVADPPSAPEEPVVRKRSRSPGPPKPARHTTLQDIGNTVADGPDPLNITPEQRHAAVGQFSHATEVIRSGGDVEYATQLLLSCCKLDPANFLYRKFLREVVRDQGSRKAGWFGSLTSFPAKGRLRAAKKAGEHRQVLEEGEELLTRLPGDYQTQMDMAESAEALGLRPLAVWLLEEVRQQAPKNTTVLRSLARLYEIDNRYKQATAVWETMREIDPSDPEPTAKIRELAVNETLSKRSYRR